MNTLRLKITFTAAVIGAIALVAIRGSQAQDAPPSTSAIEQETSVPAGMDPAAAKIWTSPQMVKARQWLHDYATHSAKVTPQEAKQYLSELEGMSAGQMKLWLLKFQEEEEEQQRQYHAWRQAHEAALGHALAMQQQIQQSYANINRDQTEAAQVAESQLDQQREKATQFQEDKLQQLNTPGLLAPDAVGPYGVGFGGFGGWGGVHYHIHVAPPAAQ